MTSRTTPSPGAVPRVQPHHADDPHALRPLLDRIGRFMLGTPRSAQRAGGRRHGSLSYHRRITGPGQGRSCCRRNSSPSAAWWCCRLPAATRITAIQTRRNLPHRHRRRRLNTPACPPTVPRTGFRSRARRGGVSLTAAAGSGPEHHRNPRRPERHGSCLPFAVSDTVTVSPGLHGRHHRPASQGRRLVTQRAPFPAEPDPRHHPPRPQILCRTRGSTRQRWCDRASSGVPDTATDRAADKER